VDCENFDRIVLDLLYDELDEIISAAVHRHLAHCTRCRRISSRLRATREVGTPPLLDAPPRLAERILSAERTATSLLPLRQRVGRTISILAGYAMRPQLAMAALLLFMIGASLLLLRARPGERESIHVTERGVPEPYADNVAILPVLDQDRPPANETETRRRGKASPSRPPSAPAAAAAVEPPEPEAGAGAAANAASDAGTPQSAFQSALTAYHDQHYTLARELFDRAAAGGGAEAPKAALFAARSIKRASGCSDAVERFKLLSTKFAETEVGLDATWDAAECFRDLGLIEAARKGYSALLDVPRYKARARAALEHLAAVPAEPAAPEPDAAAPSGSAPAQAPSTSTVEQTKAN
jgi:hypothetical protein